MRDEKLVSLPANRKQAVYRRIRQGLLIVSQAIISAPIHLPRKVVTGVKCVTVLLGVLDALDQPVAAKEAGDDS